MNILFLMLSMLLTAPQGAGPQAEVPASMAEIPAGDYWMGRVRMYEADEVQYFLRPRIDDLPSHVVTIDKFWIDKYEVTDDEYAKFVEATGHRKPYHWKNGQIPARHNQYPVYNVDWADASGYCKWAGKRLPTEAEWEKAARGGLEKKVYPWGDELRPGAKKQRGPDADQYEEDAGPVPKVAQYNSPTGPTKVGSFAPNGYGLYDTIGNVSEWVNDWYERTYYPVSPESNPPGPATGMYRVIRGSSWGDIMEAGGDEPRIYGVHFRNFQIPTHRTIVIGFRCAQTP